jgi:anaphase-promoting complex subunit 2
MRPTDLISTLVSIYDSHDLFTKELQTLFSNILLQTRDGNFDAEVSPMKTLDACH